MNILEIPDHSAMLRQSPNLHYLFGYFAIYLHGLIAKLFDFKNFNFNCTLITLTFVILFSIRITCRPKNRC